MLRAARTLEELFRMIRNVHRRRMARMQEADRDDRVQEMVLAILEREPEFFGLPADLQVRAVFCNGRNVFKKALRADINRKFAEAEYCNETGRFATQGELTPTLS